MGERKAVTFQEGDKLVNTTNRITGEFVKEFRATGFGLIVVVKVPDGRLYRAPKNEWRKSEK